MVQRTKSVKRRLNPTICTIQAGDHVLNVTIGIVVIEIVSCLANNLLAFGVGTSSVLAN